MSLKTLRNIDELHAECIVKQIPVDPFWSKTDYVKALRDYHLKEQFGDKVPRALRYMMRLDSPMLCKKYADVPQQIKDALMNDRSTIIEEKIDGCRMIMCFTRNEETGGIRFDAFSRNNSVVDFLPINYRDNIALFYDTPEYENQKRFMPEMIIDCEIVCPDINVQLQKRSAKTKTQLQSTAAILATDPDISIEYQREHPFVFKCFDILLYDTMWLADKPLAERKLFLNQAITQLANLGFWQFEELQWSTGLSSDEKKDLFLNTIWHGGEGIVLKRPNSKYSTVGNRTNDWVKIKRTMSASLGDTIDGFISGFHLGKEGHDREDLVASLDVSVYDEQGNEHIIATVANLTEAEREEMTDIELDDTGRPTGYPTLGMSYYGRVVEIDGQDISSVNHRLMHAKIIRWRPDKQAQDCVINMSEWLKYIL